MNHHHHWLVLVLLLVCLNSSWTYADGEIQEGIVSPMDENEKEALYSAIQGFVGNWWNGSDLYPDPCGWTPIEVTYTNFIIYPLLQICAFFVSYFICINENA